MGVNGIVGYKTASHAVRGLRLIERGARVRKCGKWGLSYSATKSPKKGVRTDA